MKRLRRMLGVASLGLLLVFSECNQVSAKNVYDTKYGNLETEKPYKKSVYKKIVEICIDCNEKFLSSSRKDFNGDGKSEKVVLSVNPDSNYQNADVIIKINNRVSINIEISVFFEYISFSTMKVQGRCLAVLLFGDNDYMGGGALIYLWKANQKLTLLKSYKPKGYLNIYIAKDKTLNRDVLYIEDRQQLFNRYGHKWPANVMKKYKKYANHEGTSVTKTVYHKFVYRNSALKKVGKDNYFRVGINYD